MNHAKQKKIEEKDITEIFQKIQKTIKKEKAIIMTEIEQKVRKERQFILIQDGAVASFLADTFTFAALAAVLAINHIKFDDSTFGAWMLGIIFFTAVWAKAKNKAIKIKGKNDLEAFLIALKEK